jgi:uncharacterized protein with PIN domain
MDIHLRFYAELNDFLPSHRKQLTFTHVLEGRAAVKDVIESLGVPHTEVDLILVNGESADFAYPVTSGDRISVYPVFESIDIASLVRVRPQPLREPRFVLDTHLGRLATYLRMFGIDTLYRNDYTDEELARISSHEHRILLTRDPGLLKRSAVTHGYCVRETNARRQLVEILQRFDLFGVLAPFQRCLRCNDVLQPVPKNAIRDRLEPRTRELFGEFRICPTCTRIYWKGSHYERMQQFVQSVFQMLQCP